MFATMIETIEVKELELFIQGKGEVKEFNFTQILRNEFGYIYEVRINDCEDINHYEVFKRIVNEGYVPGVGPTGLFSVRYPKCNEFGKSAWTVYTIDRAKEILETFK